MRLPCAGVIVLKPSGNAEEISLISQACPPTGTAQRLLLFHQKAGFSEGLMNNSFLYEGLWALLPLRSMQLELQKRIFSAHVQGTLFPYLLLIYFSFFFIFKINLH